MNMREAFKLATERKVVMSFTPTDFRATFASLVPRERLSEVERLVAEIERRAYEGGRADASVVGPLRQEEADALAWAGEQLIEATSGWLVARPQRNDDVEWLRMLDRYLDAHARARASTT